MQPPIPPTVGRLVHYTLAEGSSRGQVRPAVVVRTWGPGIPTMQLIVFTDEANDGLPMVLHKSSVAPSETGDPESGRWHWPPQGT